jgi:alpha-L-rhamnosidase
MDFACLHPLRTASPAPEVAFASADWIWVQTPPDQPERFVRFTRSFAWTGGPLDFHFSADQRCQLHINGELLLCGPDCGTPARWYFSSYRVELPAGIHRLSALVWSLPETGPYAHMSVEPGFLFAANENAGPLLNTGRAEWTAESCPDIIPRPERKLPGAHFIGPSYDLDARQRRYRQALPVQVVAPGSPPRPTNRISVGRQLCASELPSQVRSEWSHWRARAAVQGWIGAEETIEETWTRPTSLDEASTFAQRQPITIAPQTEWSALFDAETIVTAYSGLVTSGGRDAQIELLWCESLGVSATLKENNFLIEKGHRDEVVGKRCFGEGDFFFVGDEADQQTWSPPWWRAGRYLLLRVRTSAEPITLHRLTCMETRYPMPPGPTPQVSDPDLAAVLTLCETGFRASCHEIYADCPAFEQLMYAGDTRIQILVHRAVEHDDRLARKAIQLFNDSRFIGQGWTLSRYPSRVGQIIPGFSLIWVLMVDDFLYWRNDRAFVQAQLNGVRGTLDLFESHLGPDGWLSALPHWNFIDWTPAWQNGVPSQDERGRSAPINLFHLLALAAGARIEHACGHSARAARYHELATRLRSQLRTDLWDSSVLLFRDAPGLKSFSEQTQALAVLTLLDTREEKRALLHSLRTTNQTVAPASYYFAHYLFEACREAGDAWLYERLDAWRSLIAKGLRTPIESIEPARSDCHGWGSHPLFHLPATFLGLRPTEPGMKRVRITPLPGPLTKIATSFPWRDATIAADLSFAGTTLSGSITLPSELHGELCWAGQLIDLHPGKNAVSLA